MIVNLDVVVYTKTPKHSKNRKNNSLLKTKRILNTEK